MIRRRVMFGGRYQQGSNINRSTAVVYLPLCNSVQKRHQPGTRIFLGTLFSGRGIRPLNLVFRGRDGLVEARNGFLPATKSISSTLIDPGQGWGKDELAASLDRKGVLPGSTRVSPIGEVDCALFLDLDTDLANESQRTKGFQRG